MIDDPIGRLNSCISVIDSNIIQKHIDKGDLDDWIGEWRIEATSLSFGLFSLINILKKAIEQMRQSYKGPRSNIKGKWEVYKDCEGKSRTCTCVLCGYQTSDRTWINPKFCAGCGADMRESEDKDKPAKKGYWTSDVDDKGLYINPKCSECGGEPYYSGSIYNYKFCPFCGADMRGK